MQFLSMFLACNDYLVIDHETVYIEPQFDVFKVTDVPPGADVVFILDASGSMENDWSNVYNEIPDFQLALSQLNTDWRFTTISADKSVVNSFDWITSETDNLNWAMTSQFQYTQNQNGYLEAGLDASFTMAANHPDVFIGDNDLYFIFVSDEEDQSNIQPQTWLNLFSTFKNNPNASVGAGAIVDSGSGCGDSFGSRYMEVSQKTVDLCDTNWGRVLDPLVNRIEPEDGIFSLSHTPDPSSIRVYFDDNETDLWEYSSDLNVVQLSDIPPTGTSIVVTYYPVD
jgi:hypothetical protein